MDKEKFLDKYVNKDIISEECVSENSDEYEALVILTEGDKFYHAGVSKKAGLCSVIVGDIREVVPVSVTTTEYEEVLTLKGTRQELIGKLYEALESEMQCLYQNTSDPYVGSIQTYERMKYDDIRYIAQEAISDLFD